MMVTVGTPSAAPLLCAWAEAVPAMTTAMTSAPRRAQRREQVGKREDVITRMATAQNNDRQNGQRDFFIA
jgi:hypothetical protein